MHNDMTLSHWRRGPKEKTIIQINSNGEKSPEYLGIEEGWVSKREDRAMTEGGKQQFGAIKEHRTYTKLKGH